jgi:hypothetical protein
MNRMNAVKRVIDQYCEVGEEQVFGYVTSNNHFQEDKKCFEKLEQEGYIKIIYVKEVELSTQAKVIKLK